MEYRGPFASIPSRIVGTRIGELFPQIAERTDRLAIMRSLHTSSNDHGVAGTIGLTGSSVGSVNLGGAMAGGSTRPCVGSIVARAKAEQLARDAGVSLGRPIRIQEADIGGVTPVRQQAVPAAAIRADAPPTPIQPGELQIQTNVAVTWAIQ